MSDNPCIPRDVRLRFLPDDGRGIVEQLREEHDREVIRRMVEELRRPERLLPKPTHAAPSRLQ